MSEYMYGICHVKPSRRVAARRDKIAREEGGRAGGYVELNVREGSNPGVNGGRYQGWYVGPNRGAPWDSALSRRVFARLGIDATDAAPEKD